LDGRAAILEIAPAILWRPIMAAPESKPHSKQETGYGCLTRLSWMLFGNVALLISAKFIADHKGLVVSRADVAFWIIVALLIGIRYFDITKMEGLTASENPASLADWRRYIMYLGLMAVVLWSVAHLVAYWYK
jgi:hypothetical protein